MEDKVNNVIGCNSALIAVTTLCMGVKLYTRIRLNKASYWEDGKLKFQSPIALLMSAQVFAGIGFVGV